MNTLLNILMATVLVIALDFVFTALNKTPHLQINGSFTCATLGLAS